MIKYGLISKIDGETIESTLDLVCNKFVGEPIHVTEVGIFDGQTARGIRDYLLQRGRIICYTAIDSERDKPVLRPFEACNMIIGNSSEVYNRLEDNSQHFIFIDALHTFPAVVSDFFCFETKVKVGGFIAFHDTGTHIVPTSGWQRVGDIDDPDMCLGGVRKALRRIGLLSGRFPFWELMFDESDPLDEAGMICVFRKTLK